MAVLNADVLKVTIEGANSRVSMLNGTDAALPSPAHTARHFQRQLCKRQRAVFGPNDGPNALNGTTNALQPVSAPAVLANDIWVI
jgi:hypothetical protein